MIVATEFHDARREAVTRLGLWMFLATVMMLFAAFTSAYLMRRSGSDWSRFPLPAGLWRNTLFLVASSGALEVAWRAGRRARQAPANAAMAAALGLGLAFLVGQAQVWRELQRVGIYLPANPWRSFFYMMTGAHALHVVAALVVLLRGAAITWRGDLIAHVRSWPTSIGLCRTLWHFLLGVWVCLFVLISRL